MTKKSRKYEKKVIDNIKAEWYRCYRTESEIR